MSQEEYYDANRRMHAAQAELNHLLERFGDALAKREGYRNHKGIEAVQFYLIQKHGWLPREVKTMSFEDLRFAMEEEMEGWTIDKPARAAR